MKDSLQESLDLPILVSIKSTESRDIKKTICDAVEQEMMTRSRDLALLIDVQSR